MVKSSFPDFTERATKYAMQKLYTHALVVIFEHSIRLAAKVYWKKLEIARQNIEAME